LDRRLGEPQAWSGRGGKEKNSQPLPGLEPPIFQPVAQVNFTFLLFPSFPINDDDDDDHHHHHHHHHHHRYRIYSYKQQKF
jgi:hypothetical protein